MTDRKDAKSAEKGKGHLQLRSMQLFNLYPVSFGLTANSFALTGGTKRVFVPFLG